ncbi:MAG: hypothetical protein HLX49_01930 [Virgibacillus sp.]|nr:hypothetical protein [Virgibacillus sp.]
MDEQQQEEIINKLLMAVANDLTVTLKYFDKHDFYKVRLTPCFSNKLACV